MHDFSFKNKPAVTISITMILAVLLPMKIESAVPVYMKENGSGRQKYFTLNILPAFLLLIKLC